MTSLGHSQTHVNDLHLAITKLPSDVLNEKQVGSFPTDCVITSYNKVHTHTHTCDIDGQRQQQVVDSFYEEVCPFTGQF